jgi:RimJ/RimL family protein N-acetyltransferase
MRPASSDGDPTVLRPPETITTERLRLRPPAPQDAGAIFREYAQDTEVTRYLAWRPHRDLAETQKYVAGRIEAWKQGPSFVWVLTERDDGRLMGALEAEVEPPRVTLGFVLARPWWGRGLMTEAARPVLDWALAQQPVWRVQALCDVDNHASARVLEKLGMQREGVLRRFGVHPNIGDRPRDAACYSLVK